MKLKKLLTIAAIASPTQSITGFTPPIKTKSKSALQDKLNKYDDFSPNDDFSNWDANLEQQKSIFDSLENRKKEIKQASRLNRDTNLEQQKPFLESLKKRKNEIEQTNRLGLVTKIKDLNINNPNGLTNEIFLTQLSENSENDAAFNDIYCEEKIIIQSDFIRKIAQQKDVIPELDIASILEITKDIIDKSELDTTFLQTPPLQNNTADHPNMEKNYGHMVALRGKYKGDEVFLFLYPTKNQELILLDIHKPESPE